ncbi:hypothetical protein SAMN03080617_01819 [Algoriphagus alkaliphilus]|jgi:hypothetical protein|uniref:Lipocalin-like domain-containing protein n=1 Tax=Algoriphagus alkaliphilus TaxID=279824 RepID=A0A1G5XKH6_9BACT|nr:hypothetical protein [Algoriphagus alkaliphilus]MBA4302420.1 hypothetical protein [Cyclobacterium sp.]SDA70680.1 hypothetical protein SAMN03080617_01819 [Algoriphagus alkaliphilus]
MKSKISFLLIILSIFLSINNDCFPQKKELDLKIVGKWELLFSKDIEGKLVKNEFSGKGYIETFTKSGQFMIDPNYLRDDMKRNGINEPLDYASIPTFSWKSISDGVLEIQTGQGNQQIRYGFSGDTLVFGYPNGNTKYLLKRK